MKEAPGPRGADVARAAAIFLFVFAVYFVGYARTLPPTADEMIDFGLAQSMAKWQVFSIDQVSTVGPNPEEFGIGGHRYSKYGPLQAVLAVPLFWLAQRLPIGAVDTVLLLNHLVTAGSMALLFLLVRRLGYRPLVALGVTALVAFGTPLWVHSKRFFSEPTITLCFIATVYAAYVATTTRRPLWQVLTGLAFSAAVAAKYVDGVLLLPVPLYLAWEAWAGRFPSPPTPSPRRGGRVLRADTPAESPLPRMGEGVGGEGVIPGPVRLRRFLDVLSALIWFGVGAAPVAALLMLYDLVRFGNPIASGYAHWEGFSTPVWVGVAGFLFSPGKSIFVYTPLLLVVPFVAPRFFRRFPGFAALLGAIFAIHLVLYGSWWVWWGAWAWGPRFIVPALPLVALVLAEAFAGLTSTLSRIVMAVLGALSFVIQLLGISVDHTVYLVSLLPLNSKPDTLTLYDLRYQPILHQIPLLTRQWLDFAWIERTGPSAIDWPALDATLIGATAAVLGFVIVWRARGWTRWLPTLALAAAVVAGGVYQTLRVYAASPDPTTAAIVRAFAQAPADTGIVQLIPSDVVPYDNWQKRPLPELGWIEEPRPSPIIVNRIASFEQKYPRIWLVTERPAKAPSNGVEAMLDRSLVQVGDEPVGRFRLLRYLTRPSEAGFAPLDARFAEGIELTGFLVSGGPPRPGQTFDLTLAWQASPEAIKRADYTVFVHLVTDGGKLIAQHDDPPASGYAPTSGWGPGQVVYDDHSIAVPPGAPAGLHRVQVGLYLPSSGKRLPLVGADGKPAGDTVTIDLVGR